MSWGLAFSTSPAFSYTAWPAVLAINPTSPSTVYAGTNNGIVQSLDGGANWIAANSGLTVSQIDSLTIDPQNAAVIFATSQGKVLRTADGGAHWSEFYTPLPSDDGRATYPASMLVADPSVPGTYYVGIDGNSDGGGGVLKSTDDGTSWKRMPLPGEGGVRALTMDPQNPSTLYAIVPNHALYKSTDGGASWNVIAGQKDKAAFGAEPCFESMVIDPRNPGTLYLGTCRNGAGLSKSTDGGQTWSSLMLRPAYNFAALAVDPQNSGTVYVSDLNSVLKTTDGGQNSKELGGLPFPSSIRSMAVDPRNSSIVYAASDHGFFRSTNGGAIWSTLNSGLTNLNVQTLLIDPRDPSTIYAATNGGGVFAITLVPEP